MVKGHTQKFKHRCSAESDGGSDKENPEMSVSAGKSDGAGTGSTIQCLMRHKHDNGFEKIVLIFERQDHQQEQLLKGQRRATECLIEGQCLTHKEACEAREDSCRAREAQEPTSAVFLEIMHQGLLPLS
jgi:hypothetical protein